MTGPASMTRAFKPVYGYIRTYQGIRIHDEKDCSGYCPFDNPSNHKMRAMPIVIREDKLYLVERICKHGVGHDDPDSVAYLNRAIDQTFGPGSYRRYALGRHGCDGCCG